MTREERVELNRKRWVRTRLKIIIIGCACIYFGSARMYYWGYKDNSTLSTLSYLFLYLGWLILILVAFFRFFDDKKILFKKNRAAWFKQKFTNIAIVIIFVFMVAGNLMLLDKLTTARIAHILTTEPIGNTVAVVTGIELRNTRGGSAEYARFEFVANGEIISKAIYNYQHEFVVGKRYPITYSIAYPEMFEINHNAVL